MADQTWISARGVPVVRVECAERLCEYAVELSPRHKKNPIECPLHGDLIGEREAAVLRAWSELSVALENLQQGGKRKANVYARFESAS